MMLITFTDDQARKIVAQWNALANADNQLTAEQAHLVVGDNFDEEIEHHGESIVEVGARKSATGNPATFWVTEADVTIEEDNANV